MNCKKHNKPFRRIETDGGKTLDICDSCENEKQELFKNTFARDEPNMTTKALGSRNYQLKNKLQWKQKI
jgi:hypothetical protein